MFTLLERAFDKLHIWAREQFWVVFLYGPPTNCYAAYTDIRRKIVFICSASYAVYTVIPRKIGFM